MIIISAGHVNITVLWVFVCEKGTKSLSTVHFMLPEATESEKGWTQTNQTAVEEKLNAYFSDNFFRIPLLLISIPYLGLSKLCVLKKKEKLKISLIRTWFILPLSSFQFPSY